MVSPLEVVDRDAYPNPDGTPAHLDDVVAAHLLASERGGVCYLDGGSSLGFPRLGLTDAEREEFLEGLRPSIEALYAQQSDPG